MWPTMRTCLGKSHQTSFSYFGILLLAVMILVGFLAYQQNAFSPKVILKKRFDRVQVFNPSSASTELQQLIDQYECVRLRIPIKEEMKICTYPARVDRYISGNLIRSGTYEKDLVQFTFNTLRKHPGMSLLDLGCNIGVFTVSCAKLGGRIVAVDANSVNLLMLSRSLKLNHLENNVTFIWNAISDRYEDVTLKDRPENVGGRSIKPADKSNRGIAIKTILLDDLSSIFKNEPVFIKMDIEGSEWHALNGARQVFFKTVNVMYVLMEFLFHRESSSGKQICDFMTEFGFHPYNYPRGRSLLDVSVYTKWPNYVIWCKTNNCV